MQRIYIYEVKEPEYSDAYGDYAHGVKGDNSDLRLYYTPEILGGRINELKFKLCYGYCNTCKKTGFNVTEQNCETCLDDFSFYNSEGWDKKCVPEGYFYDNVTNSLVECTSENSKYFIDMDTNNQLVGIHSKEISTTGKRPSNAKIRKRLQQWK